MKEHHNELALCGVALSEACLYTDICISEWTMELNIDDNFTVLIDFEHYRDKISINDVFCDAHKLVNILRHMWNALTN